MAIQAESGLALPLRVTGWQASKAKTCSVAAWVASPTATAIGGAAACRRAATLTASPVRKPSPLAGSTSRADEGLAGVHADAHLDRVARRCPAGRRPGLTSRKPARNGAFGVVLVQDRHAEDGHHGVADELLHRAAVGLDGLAGDRVVAAQEAIDELGVVALREGREADQVTDQRGDGAAFFGAVS